MIIFAVIVILALAATLAVFIIDGKRQKAEREREAMYERLMEAQKQSDIEKAERLSFERIANQNEEISHEQIKNRDKISTGDDVTNFAGSVSILSDLAKKRSDSNK